MHSAGLELTKLTYTRLEDNLIRHRGDRLRVSLRCARSIPAHTSHYSRLEKPTRPRIQLATQERLWTITYLYVVYFTSKKYLTQRICTTGAKKSFGKKETKKEKKRPGKGKERKDKEAKKQKRNGKRKGKTSKKDKTRGSKERKKRESSTSHSLII